ncbi:MAG TPA: pilus assembly protein TadG-related protein [Rhizomicrobium sp.]|nr:pilus assembly protein TadG-related protein [Rhizomicrobium sp.]
MRRAVKARAFLKDRRGAISIISALSVFVLIGFTAGAVDFGNVFLRSRQLQGMADLAAMAAASNLPRAQDAALATAHANAWTAPLSADVKTGIYLPQVALAVDKRFAPVNGPAVNAVKVTLKSSAELFFASVFLGRTSLPLSRSATAARAEAASFSIGSRLLSLQGGAANAVLSALTGSSVTLQVADYNALAGAQIDLFQYCDALKTRLNLKAASFNQTLSTGMTTSEALKGISDVLAATGKTSAAQAMATLAAAATGTQKIALGSLMNLGPYGDQDYLNPNGGSGVTVSALDLATAALGLAQGGHQVQFNLASGVPGLSKITATLAIGERPANSPWIAVTDKTDVIVRTAQARLYIEAQILPLGGVLSSIASLHVPIYVELASAQAKLSSIQCAQPDSTVTLSVAPSIGQAAIADIKTSKLSDFSSALQLDDAALVDSGLIQVTGKAALPLGGLTWKEVSFSTADIAAGTVKTVKTNDLMQTLFSGLVGSLDPKVKLSLLGLGLGLGPVKTAVTNSLSTVASPLDAVVNSLTGILGLGLGEADVRVNAVRCNAVALVR